MMMKFGVAVILLVMSTALLGHGLPDNQSPKAVEKWMKEFPHTKPHLIELHFYASNLVSKMKNPPPSTPVAQANTTATSPTMFGLVTVLDSPLSEEPSSKVIGYAQGTVTLSSQEEISSPLALNFVFTDGEYKGSTFSLLERNSILREYRKLPIVGGTGDFRLANRIATLATYYLNLTAGDAVEHIHAVFYRYTLPRHDD